MLASTVAPDFVENDDALARVNDTLSREKYQSTKTQSNNCDILYNITNFFLCLVFLLTIFFFFKIIFKRFKRKYRFSPMKRWSNFYLNVTRGRNKLKGNAWKGELCSAL